MTALLSPLSLFLLLVFPPSDPHASVIAAERSASEAAWDKGIAAAFDAVLANDAVLLWPGAPLVQGKESIERFLAAQGPSLTATRFMWQPMHVEGSASYTLALTWGVMVTVKSGTGTTTATHRIGRYLAVWRRARTTSAGWQLAAFAPVGALDPAASIWNDSLGPRLLPNKLPMPVTPAVPIDAGRNFLVADSMFAADASHGHTAAAFGKWAASDAVSFASNGELNQGAARIRAAIAAGGDAEWQWAPVFAGRSLERNPIGYTIGQATITSRTPDGKLTVTRSKYLTFWKQGQDGTIRFIADGGNTRP